MRSDHTASAYMCVTLSFRAFNEPSRAEPRQSSARLEKFEQGSIDRAELWESLKMARSSARARLGPARFEFSSRAGHVCPQPIIATRGIETPPRRFNDDQIVPARISKRGFEQCILQPIIAIRGIEQLILQPVITKRGFESPPPPP
jgi:hypothetical protein